MVLVTGNSRFFKDLHPRHSRDKFLHVRSLTASFSWMEKLLGCFTRPWICWIKINKIKIDHQTKLNQKCLFKGLFSLLSNILMSNWSQPLCFYSYFFIKVAICLRLVESIFQPCQNDCVKNLPAGLTLTFWPLLQIKGMKERLDFWCGDVKNMAMLVEQQAHDILT